jgi:hypothetical protein
LFGLLIRPFSSAFEFDLLIRPFYLSPVGCGALPSAATKLPISGIRVFKLLGRVTRLDEFSPFG